MKKTSIERHTVKCPHCGKDVLDHMTECPFCKGELKSKYYEPNTTSPWRKVVTVIGILTGVAIAVLAIVSQASK